MMDESQLPSHFGLLPVSIQMADSYFNPQFVIFSHLTYS